MVEFGQAIKAFGYIGVILTQRLFSYRKRTHEERFGLGVLTLDIVELGQAVHISCHRGMIFTQRLLINRHCTFIERLGLGVFSLFAVEIGQAVQARGYIGMVGGDVFLGYCEGLFGDNDATVIIARTIKLRGLLVEFVPFSACTLCEYGRCGQSQKQKSRCNCQYVFHWFLRPFLMIEPGFPSL